MDALQASQEHADMLNTARFEALPQEVQEALRDAVKVK